jgi:hypothetical protein
VVERNGGMVGTEIKRIKRKKKYRETQSRTKKEEEEDGAGLKASLLRPFERSTLPFVRRRGINRCHGNPILGLLILNTQIVLHGVQKPISLHPTTTTQFQSLVK